MANAQTISGTTTICANTNSTLSASVSGGTWTSSNTVVATAGLSTGIVRGRTAGTATITYVHTSGTATTTVTILAGPATIGGASSLCSPGSTALTNTVSGGIWTSSATSIASVGTSGTVAGISPGTAMITYAIGSCAQLKQVSVIALPSAISGLSTICVGATLSLSSTPSGGIWSVPSNSFYHASVGSTSGIVTALNGGRAPVQYNRGGCIAYDTVTILPLTSYGVINTLHEIGGNGLKIKNGNLYYANFSVIRKIDTAGIITIIAGGGTGGDGNPATAAAIGVRDIALDNLGNLYFTDYSGGVVKKIDATGILSTVDSVATPLGIVTDTLNNIYYAGRYGVWKRTPSGTTTLYAGKTTAPIGTPPLGDGGPATAAPMHPSGLAFDTRGNLYITDWGNHVVRKVDTGGIITTVAGNRADDRALPVGDGLPATAAMVSEPRYVTFDKSGNMYISDDNNYLIRKVDTFGIISSVAGLVRQPSGLAGSNGYAGDGGAATAAKVQNPEGIAIDDDYNIYIVDRGNNRLRKVNAPVAPIVGSSVFCPGLSATLVNATAGGTWSSSTPSVATVGTSGIVTAVSLGTALISYTVSGGGCGTATVTRTITIAAGAGAISGATSVCTGSIVTLSASVSGGTWSSSNANATVSSGGHVTGVSAGTSIISYAVTTTCGLAAATSTVTINSVPLAGSISGATAVCTGATSTLTSSVSGGTWSSSSAAATISAGGVVSGVSVGTSSISYTISSTCGTTVTTYPITINTGSSAGSISGATSVCPGATITLSASVGSGTWSSSTALATVSSSGVVSGVSAGTSTISYTVTGTCGSAVATQVVTILPGASAGSISGASSVATGSTVTLVPSVSGGAWSSSNTGIATVSGGIAGGVSVGTATISYAVTGSCGSAVATKTISVNIPSSDPILGSTSICVNEVTTLSSATSGGVWASSNTARATVDASTGVVTGVGAGAVTISYTTAGTATLTLTINALPATITGVTSVCNGLSATLGNATSGGTWSSSNTAVASNSSGSIFRGVSAGTSTISYTLPTGCARAVTFTVNAGATAITGATAVCLGSTATLTNGVAGGTWSSSSAIIVGVGSSSGIVSGLLATSTVPTITYTLAGGCYATLAMPVQMSYAITGGTTICAGRTLTLGNPVSGGAWSTSGAGVASVGSTGIVTGLSAGTEVITYTTGAGCARTHTVTVAAGPTAIAGASSVCLGQTVTLTNGVSGGVWTSSNSILLNVGSATGMATGMAATSTVTTVTYTLPGGCFATMALPVTSSYAITGATSVCSGASITLGNPVTGGTWSSSATGVATVVGFGIVSGLSAGTEIISYTTTAGCVRTATVAVLASPSAILGGNMVCLGQTLTLTNSASGGTWTSSHATLASVNATTGVVTGIAWTSTVPRITYSLSGSCRATLSVTVNGAYAITGPSAVCGGATITLGNPLSGGTWSSSDASIATTGTGGVTGGAAAGTATISYITAAGCSSTKAVTVNASPAAISGPGSVCYLNTITLSSTTSGGVWTSNASTTASIGSASGIVTGLAVSSTIPMISYTMPGGCFDTAIVRVLSCGRPDAGPIAETGELVLDIVPNPNNGTFALIGHLATDEDGMLVVEIANMLGQVVLRQTETATDGQVAMSLTMDNKLASGMYLMKVSTSEGQHTFRIILDK